ncbi:unnamed protein product [Auanema sp. JU1783]|nr:unnamed protein product [Auanema sp. JU1783]
MAPPGQSSSQQLPAKELGLFKKIIKSYESKQYRFGLKYAKIILSNPLYADHGETLSMKGLILSCMGKREEALECVKKGLTSDLKSYVCWHVYGLVQRADKKYDEAIKAYKNAFRMEKDNVQILRDLSLLQIQLRDYEGYKESRYHLLRLRPNQKLNWIGYATAYHLLKDYEKALDIITEYSLSNQPTGYDYEYSELLMYQGMILRESGNPQGALEKLEENAAQIVDRVVYMETRGDLLKELGKLEDAERVWRQLIERNPENLSYYVKLEECLGLGPGADATKRLELYDAMSEKYKRASVPRRQPLYIAEGDELKKRLRGWIAVGLRKGIPSLFKNLVPLYSDNKKVASIEAILLEFIRKIEDNGYKHGSFDDSADTIESPTSALWLYLLVAQHYDRLKQTTLALRYVEKANTHTPTLIETLLIKAKIFKHAGDLNEAARILEEAQSLDTADRYINSKCAKYLLRAGFVDEAETMCSKFTRERERASTTLNDMQCMWWEIESARAYRKLSKYGQALRKAHQVEQHFVNMVEDQFDFHTYCLRKMTLCAYVQLLKMEDVLRNHEYYYQAAKLAIKIYLRMIDRPQDMNGDQIEEGMSAAEKKRLKKKLKKEREREEEAKKNDKKKDEVQFDPAVLLNPADPLEEAAKFAQSLHMLGCNHVSGYALCFEVYFKKGKSLLMLKCIREAAKLDKDHPLLHICRVKYALYRKNVTLTGTVLEIAKELEDSMFDTLDAVKLNESFKNDHLNSLPHRVAVAECNLLLDASSLSTTKNWLTKSLEDDKLQGRYLKTFLKLIDGIKYGRYGSWSADETDAVMKIAHQLFPQALSFGGGTPASEKKEVPEENHHSFE